MSKLVYFDTSALAKWYLHEAHSEEVERYLQAHGSVAISSLTVAEMRSLLARRRRDREINADFEARVFATFREDIRRGHLHRHPISDGTFDAAVHLLTILPKQALRTLDALHLALAQEIQAATIATADRVMADAAVAMKFEVVRFF